ncbi:unnamed protein product [Rhodiola kirilowii]
MGKRKRLHSKGTSTIELLPDDVLLLILSFLTTLAEKARTSILSRRWRNLWLFTTIRLDFDVTTLRHMDPMKISRAWYIAWVNKVIDTRIASPGLPSVKELQILFGLGARKGRHIDRWINFAIINRVETLHLELCPYDSFIPPPNQYKLSEDCWRRVPSGLSSLKCLKSLFLSCVNVSKKFIEFILSSCPLLEDLSLDSAGCYSDLDVSGVPPLRLRRLKIRFAEDFAITKLCAPYLTSIYYGSDKFNPQKIDVPMLTDLTVAGTYDSQPIMEYLDTFWSYIPQLEKLELFITEVQPFSYIQMPKLDKLRYLKLWFNHSRGDTDPISYQVIGFINACPMLETFAMEISAMDGIPSLKSVQLQKKKLRKLEKNCLFKCLKELKLHGAHGKTVDQVVTRFIIRNAPHLKKLSIDTRCTSPFRRSYHDKPEIISATEAKAKKLCRRSHLEIEISVTG